MNPFRGNISIEEDDDDIGLDFALQQFPKREEEG
jgi:hypothetical protein